MGRWPFAAVFILLFGLYLHRAAPTISTGDSAELAAVGATLGIAHSPGYPLFAVIGRVGSTLLPWANPAYRMNIQSCLWSALAALFVALALYRATRGLTVSCMSALLLGTSGVWLRQSMVTEVFALNSAFAAAFFFVLGGALEPLAKDIPRRILVATFVLSLGLANHHTLLFYGPALIWASLIHRRLLSPRDIAALALVAVAGVTFYLYIALRAQQGPVMNWEEPSSLVRFWKLVTRARYGSFQLAQGKFAFPSGDDFWNAVLYLGRLSWETFGVAVLAVPIGLWGLYVRRRHELGVWISAFVFSGVVFFALTRLPPTDLSRSLLDRFAPFALLPVALLLGWGLSEITLALPKRLGLAGVLLGFIALRAHPIVDSERNNFLDWDFGRALLRNTPPGTLLLSDRADEAEFALAYFLKAERRRPDVEFVDCNAGVSASIYGKDYYDIWGKPRLMIRTEREHALIVQHRGPVYYATHEPDMIPIARQQDGLLWTPLQLTGEEKQRRWSEVLTFRLLPRREIQGRRDQGLESDYFIKLGNDLAQKGRYADAAFFFRGAWVRAQPGPWREELRRLIESLRAREAARA